jgi:RNA polymerase sigma-70 factor (ECF subfamily)
MTSTILEFILTKKLPFTLSQNAFKGLYSLHSEAVYRMAIQLTGGDELVTEYIFKDAWLNTVKHFSSTSMRHSLRDRLMTNVIKLSRDYYNKQKYYMLIHDDFSERLENRTSDFKNKVDKMNIKVALQFLSVGYRHVFVLHDIAGYTHVEISELLKITEGASRSHLFRTRKVLHQIVLFPAVNNVQQYREWNEIERKAFRSAYSNVVLPEELRHKITLQLIDNGFLHNPLSAFSLVKPFSYAFKNSLIK